MIVFTDVAVVELVSLRRSLVIAGDVCESREDNDGWLCVVLHDETVEDVMCVHFVGPVCRIIAAAVAEVQHWIFLVWKRTIFCGQVDGNIVDILCWVCRARRGVVHSHQLALVVVCDWESEVVVQIDSLVGLELCIVWNLELGARLTSRICLEWHVFRVWDRQCTVWRVRAVWVVRIAVCPRWERSCIGEDTTVTGIHQKSGKARRRARTIIPGNVKVNHEIAWLPVVGAEGSAVLRCRVILVREGLKVVPEDCAVHGGIFVCEGHLISSWSLASLRHYHSPSDLTGNDPQDDWDA